MTNGWIGVDFDGTLATDEGSNPIPAMVERIKRWLSLGIEVRIVTARVSENCGMRNLPLERKLVEDWCLLHIGQKLKVTCEKDFNMYQLWDDRAVQVIKDTGIRVGDINRPSSKTLIGRLIDEESGYIRTGG
jgi:hypothetical protein